MKLSLFLIGAALTTPALGQTPAPTTPTPDAKFDWKLRLAKGQTWKRTMTTNAHTVQDLLTPGGTKTRLELDIRQTIGFKNEVIEANPTFYMVRTTYTRFDTSTSTKLNGKVQKAPALPQVSFVGLTFTLKQAPDGRVLDVTGLEELVARQKKTLDTLIKTPAEREALRNFFPSVATFKESIIKSQSTALPQAPLAVGESYSYAASVPSIATLNFSVNNKRTLIAFDGQKSIFDESATFNVAPTQIGAPPPEKTVTLFTAAAQLYLMRKHDASFPTSPAYLSKNGRVYYRKPNNPSQVIWLDPPATGIRLKESEAMPYRGVIGYNNQSTGLVLFDAINQKPSNTKAPNSRPQSSSAFKMFVTLSGTVSGQTTVDARNGLLLQGETKSKIQGRVSIVTGNGQKQTVPVLATAQTTLSTQ